MLISATVNSVDWRFQFLKAPSLIRTKCRKTYRVTPVSLRFASQADLEQELFLTDNFTDYYHFTRFSLFFLMCVEMLLCSRLHPTRWNHRSKYIIVKTLKQLLEETLDSYDFLTPRDHLSNLEKLWSINDHPAKLSKAPNSYPSECFAPSQWTSWRIPTTTPNGEVMWIGLLISDSDSDDIELAIKQDFRSWAFLVFW